MPASIERTITAPYSTLQALVFALCLSGYPCIAIFPALFEVETRIFTIPYRAFVLGISLIVFFHFFKQGVRVFTGKYFWIPLLLFWAAYSFRLFYELVLIESPLGFEPEDYLLFTYGITLGPAIAFMFPAHNRTLNLARSLTFWLSVLALAGNMVVGWETIFLSDFSRFSSEALNAVSFAALGSVTVLISLTNLLADPQPTGRNVIAKNFVRAVYFRKNCRWRNGLKMDLTR